MNLAAVRILGVLAFAATISACGGAENETEKPARAPAVGVSAAELSSLSGSIGHQVFWAGPAESSTTYELSRTKDGRVYIRYLRKGAKVGDPKPDHTTVGTYPQKNALATLKATAATQGVKTVRLVGGGFAFADKTHPTSVYVAYPGVALQIEVYDPTAARARELVVSGKVVPLGISTAGRSGARAASREDVQQLASTAGHPVYWTGPLAGKTLEVTQTSDGRVYVRYLPAGVAIGDRRPNFLTVGTYPRKDGLKALRATAEKTHAETIELAGGGLALINKNNPTSVYLAYPDQDVQIEVYDSSAARARKLVTSGRISAAVPTR
jgi:hypothetical protein